MQEPECRRRALLTYFGEKHSQCDEKLELPCDFCQDQRAVSIAAGKTQDVLQAKHEAETAAQQQTVSDHDSADDGVHMPGPSTHSMTPVRVSPAQCVSGHGGSASSGQRQLSTTAAKPLAHENKPPAVWKSAATPSPPQPLKTQNCNVPVLKSSTVKRRITCQQVVSDDEPGKPGVSLSRCNTEQIGQCASEILTAVPCQKLEKPVLKRRRYRLPFQTPRALK